MTVDAFLILLAVLAVIMLPTIGRLLRPVIILLAQFVAVGVIVTLATILLVVIAAHAVGI